MNQIEINNLVCTYYNKKTKELTRALDGVNGFFELGKTTAIVGENGCGKTTLLKVIAGLLPYDEGTIYYNGRDIDEIYVEERKFAYISQDVFLFPKKTVFDNLSLPLLSEKMPKDQIRQEIYNISKKMKIDFLLTRKPNELSIGQIQLINLAKILLKKADVYLLDEPFSNIDQKTLIKVRKILMDEIKENKATCIFVTHNIDNILHMADNVIIIENGKILEFGSKNAIFHTKSNKIKEIIGVDNEDTK